jgi:hypothetical protein
VLAFSTQVRRFKPGRSLRIFQGEKFLSTTSFGGEVKPSVPCREFAACKRSLKWRGTRYFRPNYRTFLAQQVTHFAARISSVAVTWSLLAVKVGTLNTHGVCTISLQAAVHPLWGPHTTTATTTTTTTTTTLVKENEVSVELLPAKECRSTRSEKACHSLAALNVDCLGKQRQPYYCEAPQCKHIALPKCTDKYCTFCHEYSGYKSWPKDQLICLRLLVAFLSKRHLQMDVADSKATLSLSRSSFPISLHSSFRSASYFVS